MIADLVPLGVHAGEAFGDDGPDAAVDLFPAERALVDGVLDDRRAEFTTVRGCARRALASLGVPPGPLVPGPLGAPVWPAGIVGSMTHCPGYRAAAVARAADFAGLGIDAEPCRSLPDVVARRIVTEAEARRLREDFAGACELPLDRLLFCAKEAAYKAFSPWLGARFGVREFRVRLRADGTFGGVAPDSGRLRREIPAADFTGRWAVSSGHLLAVVALPVAATTGH
ncbi:hypothetical protein BN159_6054 [Streptomyces davaonensis JCM 4913]|uniref:Phosphopantetheinyl transferase n=1 Tax=Streptomyces davaonensis (strain DSM 101723 / JCM 4913 / KCC S-0913 / 768) TaxID=1214101 RepID=K4RAL5_STRDJ|nr:4'-phosphopantetheinyl transferase superfamily protein [Streptomyces davaonensis]CCK30433.1 hypothetical protein BN159_6054 [Streptomyces davaonensis JCM 4913]